MKARIAALVAAGVAAVSAAGAATWARRRTGGQDDGPGDTASPSTARATTAPATESSLGLPPVNPDIASDPPAGDSAPAASSGAATGVALAATGPDDLTRIKGLGKVKAARLTEAGITSYAQIAAWSEEDIVDIGLRISTTPGQIKREDWVGQARALLEG